MIGDLNSVCNHFKKLLCVKKLFLCSETIDINYCELLFKKSPQWPHGTVDRCSPKIKNTRRSFWLLPTVTIIGILNLKLLVNK